MEPELGGDEPDTGMRPTTVVGRAASRGRAVTVASAVRPANDATMR